MEDVRSGVGEQGAVWERYIHSALFCCELKTALKNKVFLKSICFLDMFTYYQFYYKYILNLFL